MWSDQRLCWGLCGFTASLLRSIQFHVCSCPLTVLGNFLLPALHPSFWWVWHKFCCFTVFFLSVMVPGGCCSQGCHDCPLHSALVLVAPFPKLIYCWPVETHYNWQEGALLLQKCRKRPLKVRIKTYQAHTDYNCLNNYLHSTLPQVCW